MWRYTTFPESNFLLYTPPRSLGVLDVSNSFAVPFDEDDKDPDVYFLDHDYLESMYTMFKKVNAKEKIVGWFVHSFVLFFCLLNFS